jgi:leucyl/phenylalanyl-tRNA--protein transferase
MPVFSLDKDIHFPPVELAEENGILAVGGDLSAERLLEAYRSGIFPWYSEGDPIIWWSPDPRFVLFPDEIKISKSMRQVLKKDVFPITFDRDFPGVVNGCRQPRKREQGTWITDEMVQAYLKLHELGFAHSVEAWQDGELVGGLYGISLGKSFFGESMFTRVSNASKAAFITMVEALKNRDFLIVDCQVYTAHLGSLGARSIPREEFIRIIRQGFEHETLRGNWGDLFPGGQAKEQD